MSATLSVDNLRETDDFDHVTCHVTCHVVTKHNNNFRIHVQSLLCCISNCSLRLHVSSSDRCKYATLIDTGVAKQSIHSLRMLSTSCYAASARTAVAEAAIIVCVEHYRTSERILLLAGCETVFLIPVYLPLKGLFE